jgi:hypothetical protein
MKLKKINLKNKKAISEIVSYVLLIVIAMAMAIGVYAWLKTNLTPAQQEEESCQIDTALVLNSYSCEISDSVKIIHLSLENKGYFSIDGFFAKASNESTKGLATFQLPTRDYLGPVPGTYEFRESRFKPGQRLVANFSYDEIGSIKRIQIQPFIVSSKSKTILPCENKIDVDISDCEKATTPTGPSYSCTPPVSDGLVSWWRFENDAQDCMNNNDGEEGNPTTFPVKYATGYKGYGITNNGSNGHYLKVDSSSSLEFGINNFTISLWVYPLDRLSTKYNLINKYMTGGLNRWKVSANGSNIIFYKDSPGALYLNSNTGVWQNIVFSREGNNAIYCINRVCSTNNGFFNGINFDNMGEMKFGCDEAGVNCLNGTIDEVMIFNRTLSQSEVDQIYALSP